jgi:hypothetical protein
MDEKKSLPKQALRQRGNKRHFDQNNLSKTSQRVEKPCKDKSV